MTETLHELAALLYLAAGVTGWRATARGLRTRALMFLFAAGVLVHAGGFVMLHREVPPIPLESFPAALSLIGWLIAAGYLLSLRFAAIRGVGAWAALTAALFTGIATVDLLVGPPVVSDRAGSGAWSHAHVLLSAAGFSFLALASLAGVAYLAVERALKHKSPWLPGLPSLESLDRTEHFTLAVGFPLLTLGVITGFVWGFDRSLSPWTPHTLWLLLAWSVYLLPVSSRVLRHQHGDRPARGVVLGFLVLAFSYVGVRLWAGGA